MEKEKLRKIEEIVDGIGFSELDGKVQTRDDYYEALVKIYEILHKEHKEDIKVKTPWIGFSNETLKDLENIKEGDKVPCPICGELVLVENIDPGNLQFIEHCLSSWLVGVDGKYVGNEPADCSGNV
jgi:hypothetical protein